MLVRCQALAAMCNINQLTLGNVARIQLPAALSTSKRVSMAHFFPGPGAYFSTADSIPEEHEDLNSASEIVRSRLYYRR